MYGKNTRFYTIPLRYSNVAHAKYSELIIDYQGLDVYGKNNSDGSIVRFTDNSNFIYFNSLIREIMIALKNAEEDITRIWQLMYSVNLDKELNRIRADLLKLDFILDNKNQWLVDFVTDQLQARTFIEYDKTVENMRRLIVDINKTNDVVTEVYSCMYTLVYNINYLMNEGANDRMCNVNIKYKPKDAEYLLESPLGPISKLSFESELTVTTDPEDADVQIFDHQCTLTDNWCNVAMWIIARSNTIPRSSACGSGDHHNGMVFGGTTYNTTYVSRTEIFEDLEIWRNSANILQNRVDACAAGSMEDSIIVGGKRSVDQAHTDSVEKFFNQNIRIYDTLLTPVASHGTDVFGNGYIVSGGTNKGDKSTATTYVHNGEEWRVSQHMLTGRYDHSLAGGSAYNNVLSIGGRSLKRYMYENVDEFNGEIWFSKNNLIKGRMMLNATSSEKYECIAYAGSTKETLFSFNTERLLLGTWYTSNNMNMNERAIQSTSFSDGIPVSVNGNNVHGISTAVEYFSKLNLMEDFEIRKPDNSPEFETPGDGGPGDSGPGDGGPGDGGPGDGSAPDPNDPWANLFDVIFKDHDGRELIQVQKVWRGMNATPPENDPSSTGYIFTGWSHSYEDVQSDLEIFAQYKAEGQETFNVIFRNYDGTALSGIQKINKGGSATPPSATPVREDHTFIGWDKGFSNVQSDLEIYAEFGLDEDVFDVIFRNYNGTPLTEIQKILRGRSARPPATPTKAGHTFIGWDKDFSNVQSDLEIFAQFELGVTSLTTVFDDPNTTITVTKID